MINEEDKYKVGDLVKLCGHADSSMDEEMAMIIYVIDDKYSVDTGQEYEVLSLKTGVPWIFSHKELILISSTQGEKNE